MKISSKLMLLLIITSSLYSQQKFPPGNYIFTEDFYSMTSGTAFRIEEQKIKSLYFSVFLMLQESPPNQELIIEESSSILKNNATVTTITTLPRGEETETITKNIFYIGHPFVYSTNYSSTINYYNGASFFEKEKPNTNKSFVGFARPWPTLYKHKGHINVGRTSSDNISIEEIRLTDISTEITISINTKRGSLHPPESEKAYFLSLTNGRKLKLLAQFGWNGNDYKNYGSWVTSNSTKKKCVLYFEKISIQNLKDGINLEEGKCKDNCWNFYDIKI